MYEIVFVEASKIHLGRTVFTGCYSVQQHVATLLCFGWARKPVLHGKEASHG
jgi:hypothetical protein